MVGVGEQRIHRHGRHRGIGRLDVTPIAGPGVHFDFGEAGAHAAVHRSADRARDGKHGRMWMVPLLAFTNSTNVTFFLGSSVEEITPSRILQLRRVYLERLGCALEQVLAQLVGGVAERAALQLRGQAAVPARRRAARDPCRPRSAYVIQVV